MTLDINALEKRLLVRKSQLLNRLNRIEGDLESPREQDFSEQATERENDQVLEEIGSTGLDELQQIEAALTRIQAGTYGICAVCEEPIAEKRLEIIPHAIRCTECSEYK